MKRLSNFFERTGSYTRMTPTQQKVVQKGHKKNNSKIKPKNK